MAAPRQLYVSIVQFLDEFNKGTLTISDMIRAAADYGVDGIELRREQWPNYAEELNAARALADELKLGITYATMATLFGEGDAHRQQVIHDIDTAAKLGSPLLRVFSGPIPTSDDDPAWQVAAELSDYAEAKGVVLALENFGGAPGRYVEEIARILERLPKVATNIDIGNYALNEPSVIDAIARVGARAVSTHLKDQTAQPNSITTYLGQGDIPLREVMAALDALPQPLIHCFEFDHCGDRDKAIRESIAFLRNA